MNQTEHHSGISELGFTVSDRDLPSVVQYQGEWSLTGKGEVPDNFWAVTFEGKGVPVTGNPSPQEILMEAHEHGLQYAYVAPYGCYVEGDDGMQLHEWIKAHRNRQWGSKEIQ